MRIRTCKAMAAMLLAAVALVAVPGCTSEKKTSKQTTYRSVGSASKSSGTSSATAKGSTSKGKVTTRKTSGKVEKGEASYYADKFHGRATASGEKYDKTKLTGAHRTLPFGTIVRVTNTANGKSVDIRINDRGPFKAGRVVDLSRAAAEKVDMIKSGVIKCTVEVISQP